MLNKSAWISEACGPPGLLQQSCLTRHFQQDLIKGQESDGRPVVTSSNRAIEAYRNGNLPEVGSGGGTTGGGPE